MRNLRGLLLDDVDRHLLESHQWHFHPSGKTTYVRGYEKGKRKDGLIYLHRLIMKAKPDEEVDHKNHSGLDNRRGNLVLTNRTGNNHNRRGVKGYHFHQNAYRAEIWKCGKKYYLGRYRTKEEARRAYLRKKRELVES